MTYELQTPGVADLEGLLDVLRGWQHDKAPFQLHPGDIGWFWRTGAESTAAALRTWHKGGQVVALGLLDGSDLLRLAIAPDLQQDEALAEQLVTDLSLPDHGVLPEGTVYVEAPVGALVHDALGLAGWPTDAPWAVLRRDLSTTVEEPTLRVEQVGPEQLRAWATVHSAAFGSTVSVDRIVDRWHALAEGPAFSDARCLLGLDDADNAVAAIIAWSAGPGRPGLIEPMGAHPDHRGHGHGRAITVAAAAALQELGCTAATVATTTANEGAVATYRSAGFDLVTERLDRRRDG